MTFAEPSLIKPAPETKRIDVPLRDVWRDGTFEGYASLFGREDLGNDIIEPGAFRATIAERGPKGIRLLWQHDPGEPIGVWEKIHEDARGLFVRGRLTRDVARAREALALMRDGAVDGLSIGFKATRARRERTGGTRRLLAVDLWEISVVTFPMQPGARIRQAAAPAPPPPRDRSSEEARLVLRMAEAARQLRRKT